MTYEWVSAGRELLADWRKPTGQAHAEVMREHLPFYNNSAGSFLAAKGEN